MAGEGSGWGDALVRASEFVPAVDNGHSMLTIDLKGVARPGDMRRILDMVPDVPPMPGDEK